MCHHDMDTETDTDTSALQMAQLLESLRQSSHVSTASEALRGHESLAGKGDGTWPT